MGADPTHRSAATGRDVYRVRSEGELRKRIGQALVAAKASSESKEQLDVAIKTCAMDGGLFTVDDVREQLPADWFGHPNLVGSRMAHWATCGLIQSVGRRRGTRPEQHGRWVEVWRGVRS
ncbi:MAG: hypothetical protein ABR585_14525 [Gemmatimonadaceae bacterium]